MLNAECLMDLNRHISNLQDGLLRIARKKDGCRVLGPGSRAVVWFHGCSRGCPGCIAAEMNRSDSYELIKPKELSEWVLSCQNIDGVTLTGGEPFEQDFQSLHEFLRLVKEDKRNLGVILFTGFYREELPLLDEKNDFMQYIDVLIDGPYMEERNDNRDLRGSNNQRIHFLTQRYVAEKDMFFGAKRRNLEIELDMDNGVLINGIPRQGFKDDFSRLMREKGYGMEF